MGQLLLVLVVAVTVAAVIFGVAVLVTGGDPGLSPAEPDGRAVPLPGTRPLRESDIATIRFDTTLRGYRMAQVDQALRRAAYDIGYKDELIGVLEAEVAALRVGNVAEADALRRAREAAVTPANQAVAVPDAPDEGAGTTPEARTQVAEGLDDSGLDAGTAAAEPVGQADESDGPDANGDAHDPGAAVRVERP